MKESFGIDVPAFQASIVFVSRGHARKRMATSCRRFAPGFLPTGSNHKVANGFQSSLEEAAVSRPGRKAGMGFAKPSSAEGAARQARWNTR